MERLEDYLIFVDTFAKIKTVMEEHEGQEIRISYSGGSDSDIVAWLFKYLGYNIKLVFYDTGLEYKATKNHLEYMKSLGYSIDIVKPKNSIPSSIYHHGVPFLSKNVSAFLGQLQKYNFDFKNDGMLEFDELHKKYPRIVSPLRWWTNNNTSVSNNISWNRSLKEFLIENNGVPFPVSAHCCESVKKLPSKKYAKENNVGLMILGIRKAEGGKRATSYNSCYIKKGGGYSHDIYFPIFWWTNKDKAIFEEITQIKNSDCYSVYGLKRTGCAGCPFGQKFEEEISIISSYEPKLEKAVKNLFGISHEWIRKYKQYKEDNPIPGYYGAEEVKKRRLKGMAFRENPVYKEYMRKRGLTKK